MDPLSLFLNLWKQSFTWARFSSMSLFSYIPKSSWIISMGSRYMINESFDSNLFFRNEKSVLVEKFVWSSSTWELNRVVHWNLQLRNSKCRLSFEWRIFCYAVEATWLTKSYAVIFYFPSTQTTKNCRCFVMIEIV